MTEGLEVGTDEEPKEIDISDLTKEELQLVEKGKQNYGEEAFMIHILPPYLAIRQEYGFPIRCLEGIVEFPEKISQRYRPTASIIKQSDVNKTGHKYKPELNKIAESVGKDLEECKELWDHNRMLEVNNGIKINKKGITVQTIETRLVKIAQVISPSPYNRYHHSHR